MPRPNWVLSLAYCVYLFLVCRYDSLNNLDLLYPNLTAIYSSPRPHSAAGGYVPVIPSRNAASRYSTGSMSSKRNAYADSFHYARYAIHMYEVLCFVLDLKYSGLTVRTCAAPGWSVARGLAVCVSESWVVGQPWS